MKIMVTGSAGQLGTDVVALLREQGHSVIGADLPMIDITDYNSLEAVIKEEKPEAVIHLAAYTAVDKAEEDKELCYAVNVTGTGNVAKICGKNGIKLLYTSTDYVFNGEGDEPFETDSSTGPKNYYGLTKLMGEEKVREYCDKYFIVRISWVFGVHGKNFVYTMLRLSETRDEISVVSDQIGSVTFTPDLARLISDVIVTEKYGTYHATNEGLCSWYEFAQKIMELAGRETKIIPIKTKDYKTAAVRPLNSRLSKKSLDEAGFKRLPQWEYALERFIKSIN